MAQIEAENRTNHHCTCVQINYLGIMIEGHSGTGKSALGLGLIDAAQRKKISANFVCDDQAILNRTGGELWASPPRNLAGKAELHGFGIISLPFIAQCKIALVCELVDQDYITRLPDKSTCLRLGIKLDYIQVPRQHEAQGIRILMQKIGTMLL